MRIVPFVLSVLGVLAVFLSGCMNVIGPDTDEECKPITQPVLGEIKLSNRIKEKGIVFRKYSNDEFMIEFTHENKKMLLGGFGEIYYGLGKPEHPTPFFMIDKILFFPFRSLALAFPRLPCDIPREETTKKFFTDKNLNTSVETRNEKDNVYIELTAKTVDDGIVKYSVHLTKHGQTDDYLDVYLNFKPLSPLQDDYDLSGWKYDNGDAINDSLGALRRK